MNIENQPAQPVPALPDAQTVTEVQHYTDRLFRFRCTRPASMRFRSGEFVMIGLMGDPDPKTGKQKPLLRAYSIASPSWDDELEFYSIKVPDGPLTSKLQHIAVGDELILRPKPVGTLVHDALLPGKRLYFFSTGTGFAPMLELLGSKNLEKLRYYPTTTREDSPKMGRITTLIESGELFDDLNVAPFDPANDRAMICGSLAFNIDVKALLEKAGLKEGANSDPAQFVVEKAFVGDGV